MEVFGGEQLASAMRTSIVSFGFKHGVPLDVDLMFDCRFLPNPYWVESLRNHSGLEPEVRKYVLDRPETSAFLDKLDDLLAMLIPAFQREGKSYLTVAMGCTGGRHRSVVLAEELAGRLDAPECLPRSSTGTSNGDRAERGRAPGLTVRRPVGGRHRRRPRPCRHAPGGSPLHRQGHGGGFGGRRRRIVGPAAPAPATSSPPATSASASWPWPSRARSWPAPSSTASATRSWPGTPSATWSWPGCSIGRMIRSPPWTRPADFSGRPGRVLPATVDRVVLKADSDSGRVDGQVAVMGTGHIRRVSLVPSDPEAPAEVLAALDGADQIILGPGSLFTSVLAAVAVPAVRERIGSTPAQTVYVSNLRPQLPETEGFDVGMHVGALSAHGVEVDVVVCDSAGIPVGRTNRPVVDVPLARANGLAHDPARLASVLSDLLG